MQEPGSKAAVPDVFATCFGERAHVHVSRIHGAGAETAFLGFGSIDGAVSVASRAAREALTATER